MVSHYGFALWFRTHDLHSTPQRHVTHTRGTVHDHLTLEYAPSRTPTSDVSEHSHVLGTNEAKLTTRIAHMLVKTQIRT